ncbi:MAG: MFS transporter, partial [Clostridiales Family XIII bacterium]|nr:MFS transporter [Clostridiales Family XIII bacterium]
MTAETTPPPLTGASGNASVEEANVRLNFLQRLPFFMGTFGGSFVIITILSMLSFYWTDVMHIDPAMVSAFLLITKLWDAVNDPIIGYIADRTQTKAGRYRPWLLMCIPTSVFGLLTFVRLPGVSDSGAAWFSMIMYFVYVLSATCVEVPDRGCSPQPRRTSAAAGRSRPSAWRAPTWA